MTAKTAPRFVLAATVTLTVTVLCGCAPTSPAAPGDPRSTASSTPTTSAQPTPSQAPTSATSDQEATLRSRLANALRTASPANARLVSDTTTKVEVVDTTWLPGWSVVDVTSTRPPHPVSFSVGLSESDEALYLSGKPDAFNAMTQAARVRVGSGATAVAISGVFLDSIRTFQHYSYRIDDVSDVVWRDDLTPAERSARERFETTYAQQVVAPRATPAGEGWTLTEWMIDDHSLVRHDLTISGAGAVSDNAQVVASGLPNPDSL